MKEGWRREILKDVIILKSGKTVSKDIEKDIGAVIYTKVGDMNLAGNEVNIVSSSRYVDFEDVNESQIIPKGSIIFPKRGGAIATNKKRRIVKPTIVDLNTMALVPSDDITSDYLYFWFKTVDLNELSNGANVPQINNYSFDNTFINFPKSLEEQQKIVTILDEAFEAIDQAQANIEKNIENAKELFQSKLNEIFSQKGEGWEEKSIEEVSEVINGYSFKSTDFSAENGVKAIKITNVGINEFVEDISNNLPKVFLEKYSKVKVQEGNIVLALTRTIISSGLKVARVPNSYNDSLVNQRVAAIIPKANIVDGEYLYHFFSSEIVYNYVLSNVNTLMQPNLSIKDLKRLKVPITFIDRQIQISEKIEELSELKNSIIKKYQQKLTNLEDLKKSILEQAFAGDLTHKDMSA